MALPTRVTDQGRIRTNYGVAFALFPGDSRFAIEAQRADDSGGSPDLGALNTVGFLAPGAQLFVDPSLGSQSSTYHYRFRHVRTGYDDGTWTAWFAVKSAILPDILPTLPSEPNLGADLLVDPATGNISIEVNGAPRVRSVKWALELVTTTFPASDTGTSADTDSNGDVSIATGQTQSANAVVRATVTFYEAAGGTGTILGTLRLTSSRGVTSASALPLNAASVVLGWVTDPAAGEDKYNAALAINVGADVKSLDITGTDAPLNVDSDYIVNLTAGELANRNIREILKASKTGPKTIDPGTDADFDATDSDGCLFSVTPYDAIDGSRGAGNAGDTVTLGEFIPQTGQDVNASGIEDMKGVSFAATADAQVVRFESSSGLWKNTLLDAGDIKTGTLGETRGGTGNNTWVQYDIPYADGTNTLGAIPIGSNGEYLTILLGVPQWAALASHSHDHGALTGLADDDHSQYVHISNARTITAVHTFSDPTTGLKADVISEASGASGVTIDGLLIKDSTISGAISVAGQWTFSHASGLKTDTIAERVAAAGVTVDGLLIKDGGIPVGAVTTHQTSLSIAVSQLTGTLGETSGGTGNSSWAQGDLPYASGINTLVPLTKGTTGQLLEVDGLGNPSWATVAVGVSDHGALTGLTDDDHSQYVHMTSARTISALHTFNHASGLKAAVITEKLGGGGVTIDGLLIKDSSIDGAITVAGQWTFSHASGLKTDDILERTSAAGVTIDSLLIKDGGLPSTGAILASGNGTQLGDTTNRWDGFMEDLTIYARGRHIPGDLGTKSSGTETLDPLSGNLQFMTNNGAFTLAPITGSSWRDGEMIVLVIGNGASAGTITFSGNFDWGDAGAPTHDTTNNEATKYVFTKWNNTGNVVHAEVVGAGYSALVMV